MTDSAQPCTASVRTVAQSDESKPIGDSNRAPGIEPVEDAALYAWQQVVRQVLGLIAAGEWPAGRRIPSEPHLMHGFAVARGTLRKATDWLGDRGVIVRRQGRGSFIADPLPDPLPEPPQ